MVNLNTKDRVRWETNTGREQVGTYIFDFKHDSNKGYAHVVLDSGQKCKVPRDKLRLAGGR